MSLELTTSKSADVEQIELFSIDGKGYTIPNKARVNLALRYLKMARNEGADAASAYMLEEMVGEEGYNALMNYEDLTSETLTAIMEAAQKVVLGGLTDPKAK